jgi:hypothetical protein
MKVWSGVFVASVCALSACRDSQPPAGQAPPATAPSAAAPAADTAGRPNPGTDTVVAVSPGGASPSGYPDSFFAKIPNGVEVIPGFFEVYLSRPDSTIRQQPAYDMVYVPRSEWKDTLNALVIHRDSSEKSAVVALLGVRKRGNGWQRVYATRARRVLGALQRVSNDEWALGVDDRFSAWALVRYAYSQSGALRGWVRIKPPRVVIREADRPPKDTSRANLAIVARFRALIPDSVLVRRNACPFECCTYRDWKATHEIPVYRNEMDRGKPIFMLRTGESFHAPTGNVHITGIAVVVVNKKIPGDTPQHTLQPGDTIVMLNSLGEGFFSVWKKNGQVIDVAGEWSGPPWKDDANRQLGNYDKEWWVKVHTFGGREGWIHADSARFTNADRCG